MYRCEKIYWYFDIAFSRPGSDRLSRVLRRSTMGAGAFHGRVRNGNGCSHPAITTRSAKGNVEPTSGRFNEKLVQFSLLLNTSFFSSVCATAEGRKRERASPIVWRAVRSVATKSRQREDRRDGIIKAKGFDEHGQ